MTWFGLSFAFVSKLALAALLLTVSAASAGLAADAPVKPVQVDFEAPESCSGATAFYESLRTRTERVRRAEGDEERTTLRVRLTRQHGHVLGELRMLGDHGVTDTRRVQGATCDEVVQALSLTAALALDPTAQLSLPTAATPASSPSASTASASSTSSTSSTTSPASTTSTSPSTSTSSTSSTSGPPSAEATPAPVARPSPERPPNPQEKPEPSLSSAPQSASAAEPRPPLVIGAGAIAWSLLSGSSSPGLALTVRKTASSEGAFRPSLGLTLAYLRNDVTQSAAFAKVGLAAAALSGCPLRGTVSFLTFEPCAVLVAGWLSASATQVTQPSTIDRLWLSVAATMRTSAWLGHGFSVELEAGIQAVLLKRRLYTTLPSHVVAETPTWSPLLALALAYGW